MDRLRLLIDALRMLARQPGAEGVGLLAAERAIDGYLPCKAPLDNRNLSACARPSAPRLRSCQAKVAFGFRWRSASPPDCLSHNYRKSRALRSRKAGGSSVSLSSSSIRLRIWGRISSGALVKTRSDPCGRGRKWVALPTTCGMIPMNVGGRPLIWLTA